MSNRICLDCGIQTDQVNKTRLCWTCLCVRRAANKRKCACGRPISSNNKSGICPPCKHPRKHETVGKGTNVREVLRRAEEVFGVASVDVLGPSRCATVLPARFAVMAALKVRGFPLCEIGRRLGRDHSTVLNGIRRAREIAGRDPQFARVVEEMSA